MAKRLASLWITALAALSLGVGCDSGGPNISVTGTNIPPETTLSFNVEDGGSATYRVRVNWFGWDPDGYISRFDIRTALDGDMTPWWSVVSTDSVILFGPDLPESWGFWVRAVDNDGLADATPESVVIDFTDWPLR